MISWKNEPGLGNNYCFEDRNNGVLLNIDIEKYREIYIVIYMIFDRIIIPKLIIKEISTTTSR